MNSFFVPLGAVYTKRKRQGQRCDDASDIGLTESNWNE